MEPDFWRGMGLTDEEFTKIQTLMGREPNELETAIFAVMWSEHCSYKTSKPIIKRFPTSGPQVLQGPGENAGIVDIGDGLAVVFKMESHNHPSAIEPYQGAATGVGGILRDIFTMGARPIAILDSLRFGPLEEQRNRRLISGVVAGIGGYGNSIGIPTVGGEVYFHPSYNGNPLVNVMAVGLIRHEDIARGAASGAGNSVMVVGARTGRDGIHGATFASVELSAEAEEKRTAVQVGDPFMEKLLMEACLELIESGALVGIQDLGAAGLTSASSEMASRGGSGMELDLSLVPRRESGMTPHEVMLSESQERMLLVPKPGREQEVKHVLSKWDLEAAIIGKVTSDGMLRLYDGGEMVAEIRAQDLTEQAPVYRRVAREPDYYRELRAASPAGSAETPTPDNTGIDYLTGIWRQLLGSPNLADKEWIYSQYDYQVGTNTVVVPGADAAVVRVRGTKKGIAMTTDGNSRYVYLDPYVGGALAVVEAAQNLVCTGAQPLAITNCLNFGNPEKPEVFWQLEQACAGIADACRVLGTPVTGGNVSLYNETNGQGIYPTPIIGMIGLVADIQKTVPGCWQEAGQPIFLLGELPGALAGSEYLALNPGKARDAGGVLPELDLAEISKYLDFFLNLGQSGLVQAAHDVVEGGLAVALAEMAAACGSTVDLPLEPGMAETLEVLFGERLGRILFTVLPEDAGLVQEQAARAGILVRKLGQTGGDELVIRFKGESKARMRIEEVRTIRCQTLQQVLD